MRQVEGILFGSETHSSNVFFDLNELGLESSKRVYHKPTIVEHGMNEDECAPRSPLVSLVPNVYHTCAVFTG